MSLTARAAPSFEEIRHARVAIVGTGFGGIGMAARLKMKGIDDLVVFERASDVGGVWRENVYPGCACDVQSHLYSLSFAQNPKWTRSYSPQPEILAYLRDCADRFDVRRHVRFNHDVEDATWDDARQRWVIRTSQGSYTAEVFITAVGGLSAPAIPNLPGLQTFRGKVMHSAQWDSAYDLTGKRVAVVGTGASAIQLVPAIQPKVAKLHLLQRTPAWIMPRNDRGISGAVQRLYGSMPGAQRMVRGGIYALRELLAIAFVHPRILKTAQKIALKHLEKQVPDPELRRKLTPGYTMGCKRILVSDDYLPAVAQPNVELIAHGAREVREHAIVAADGTEREVDAIIFGTGFHVTDMPIGEKVRGRDGQTLAQVWRGSPKAHLGTTVAGFPNLFMLQGPNTGLGHTSVITMIESQMEHVLKALAYMEKKNLAALEPTEEAQQAFVAEVDQKMTGTVWMQGGCASWYVDATGRNSTLWPGFTFTFKRRVERFNPREYVGTARRAGPAREVAHA